MPDKKISSWNPVHWLNSVPFGIVLMVAIASYIAVGSGRPWLREVHIDQWPGMQYWFDLSDLQFFDAWPLKIMMALLVANLIIVTLRRIPLTPPRYGVWLIHSGIITLIFGTSWYYHFKLEGRVRLFKNPATGMNSADHFYDKDERSLYLKIGNITNFYPLPMLPRFKEYDDLYGNVNALRSRGLFDQDATLAVPDSTGKTTLRNISEFFGGKAPMKFDVIGYYPYAAVATDFVDDPNAQVAGIRLSLPALEGREGSGLGPWWLISTDPRFAGFPFAGDFGVDLEHVQGDSAAAKILADAAGKIFQITAQVNGHETSFFIQSGKTYTVPNSGYNFVVENFDPAFPMSGTGEIVKVLTVRVTSPTQTFRRMIIDGRPLQTDFQLNVDGAGPMGKRQKEPLDNQLVLLFRFSDPSHLMPREGAIKHTLVTLTGSPALVDITSGLASGGLVNRFENGSGDIPLSSPGMDQSAPFAGPTTASTDSTHPKILLHIERKDHLHPIDSIRPVPAARRDRNIEDMGAMQVAKVRLHSGDWSQDVFVPYSDDAYEAAENDNALQPWMGGFVSLPGMSNPIQLQLGNTRREMPAKLTLNKFELVPYPGGHADSRSLMRDFRSTVTLDDPDTGDRLTDVAHMNSPIYYRDGRWLFFQAAYDGRSQEWTQLGVGNRPGVWTMITGFIMIFVGLMYAFYAKPIIIRNMKQRAIARAALKKSAAPVN